MRVHEFGEKLAFGCLQCIIDVKNEGEIVFVQTQINEVYKQIEEYEEEVKKEGLEVDDEDPFIVECFKKIDVLEKEIEDVERDIRALEMEQIDISWNGEGARLSRRWGT